MLTLYKYAKSDLEYECYLDKMNSKHYRQIITKIRISAHKLRIETGRYGRNRLERNERLCLMCENSDNEVEDEYHFIFICNRYRDIRKKYIPCRYYIRPSMWKLLELLNSKDSNMLNNLACFISKALEIRDTILNNIV